MGYGYGYGMDGLLANGTAEGLGTFFLLLVVGAVVALIGSFIVFAAMVSKPEGKSGSLRQASNASFMQRFVRFQKMVVADVVRWFFLFETMLVGIEGLIIFIGELIASQVGPALITLLLVPFIILVIRVHYEMQMLTVHLTNDASHIRAILADKFGESDGGLDLGIGPTTVQPDYQQPVMNYGNQYQPQSQPQFQPQPQPQPQPSDIWYCPNCGTSNRGAFCKQCGQQRR